MLSVIIHVKWGPTYFCHYLGDCHAEESVFLQGKVFDFVYIRSISTTKIKKIDITCFSEVYFYILGCMCILSLL